MDGSRQRSTGDVARIMRHGRRCANVDRAVSTEVDESNGHFRTENHEHPVSDIRARQFPSPPARESVSGERFPERAAYRLSGIQDGIAPDWIAEPTGSGDGPERVCYGNCSGSDGTLRGFESTAIARVYGLDHTRRSPKVALHVPLNCKHHSISLASAQKLQRLLSVERGQRRREPDPGSVTITEVSKDGLYPGQRPAPLINLIRRKYVLPFGPTPSDDPTLAEPVVDRLPGLQPHAGSQLVGRQKFLIAATRRVPPTDHLRVRIAQ